MSEEKRTKMNECYSCEHRRTIPGDAHIACMNPDPNMEGDIHGIRSGWFFYPYLYDPIWKVKDCKNYREE